jgi:F0F1-type ATP synthase membrane subunit b/b'
MTTNRPRTAVLAVFIACALLATAQTAPSSGAGHKTAAPDSLQTPPNKDEDAAAHAAAQPGVGNQLAEASKEAAGEENEQFKLSPTVRWLANATGMSATTAYWVFILINFAAVGLLVFVLMRSKLPLWFRSRNESIRSQIEEARKMSADAGARLGQIEARLGRLDAEISEMHAAAEADARKEEERIAAAAAEEKQRIITQAEQEIDAFSRLARRELKGYAADLAIALAERRIHVDAATDRALVREFADQLGKDGR